MLVVVVVVVSVRIRDLGYILSSEYIDSRDAGGVVGVAMVFAENFFFFVVGGRADQQKRPMDVFRVWGDVKVKENIVRSKKMNFN